MKIKLLLIGRTTEKYIQTGIDEYVKRMSRFAPFEIKVLTDIRAGKSLSESEQKRREGQMMAECFMPGDAVILLDERGKEYTSRQFADFVEGKMNNVARTIWFVIGGPYGFADEIYDRSDFMVSMSRMTLPHELIRLVFVEQLYRAMTIMRGLPYHHD